MVFRNSSFNFSKLLLMGIILSNSVVIIIFPLSSNSHIILSGLASIYIVTDFVFPIVFINFKMVVFGRNGILTPSDVILSVYKRYISSCLDEKLYLINGFSIVA